MSRARSRSRLSVAPGFQELAGLPGTLSTGRGGYLGQRDRRPAAGSRRASRAPHRPPAARGRRPAQVKRRCPPPASSYLLHFGLQVHVCVSKEFLLLSRISRPGSPGLRLRCRYWGRTCGDSSAAAGATRPAPSNFRRPVRRSQPAAGTREQRDPGSQWQRGSAGQPPITERRTHLRGRSWSQAR